MNKREIFTLSNIISFIRIFFSVPIFYYISVQDNTTALIFIAFAVISDWLDGYFARKWNQITTLGKIIDPLADKACTIGGFLALSLYQGLPFWVTAVIIIRDVVILITSLVVIGQKNIVMASNIPGKITVLIISILGMIYLLQWEYFKFPLLILAMSFILYSSINYTVIFFKNLMRKDES